MQFDSSKPLAGGSSPVDQAHGLRQMFVQSHPRFIPVASNPFVEFSGVLMERLCSAYAEMKMRVLVVDVSETAVPPHELTAFDLSEGIENLSSHVSFLSAPGMAMQYLDAQGTTKGFLEAVSMAALDFDVVLVLAEGIELCRLWGAASADEVRPHALLLADDQPEAITHAYTNLKLLSSRSGIRVHHTLLACPPQLSLTAQVADRISRCGASFLNTIQRRWTAVDPLEAATLPPSEALMMMAHELGEHALTVMDSSTSLMVRSSSAGLSLPSVL